MSSNLKIALLCDNKMAVPALQRLASGGVLCSVATADKDAEVVYTFSGMALTLHVPYHKISHENYREQLRDWLLEAQPDIVFVITFPWRITAPLLAMPRLGFLNFHFGLLPEMRGADPIFESIRQRKDVAGTTVHRMDEHLDTGPILLREEVPLHAHFTYGMLSSQMASFGAQFCERLVGMLESGNPLEAMPQDETKAAYWPKIGEAELAVNWQQQSIEDIIALVRACNPIARGVPVLINNWKIGVCDVSEVNLQGDASAIVPGTILAADQQNGLVVCCKGGKAIKLEVIYTAEGVFPGHKLGFFGIAPGMVFESPAYQSKK